MIRTLRSQSDYKKTLLRNQLTSLILFEAVTTTKAKGKDLISFANHFFSKVKKGDLQAMKLAHQTLFDKNAIKKTFDEILPRYDEKATTYVRAFRVMPRRGDIAEQMMVAFIKPLVVEEPKKEKKDK